MACVSNYFENKIPNGSTYLPSVPLLFLFFFVLQFIMDLQLLSPVPTVTVKSGRMNIDDENIHLVNPGETVTTDQQFMR